MTQTVNIFNIQHYSLHDGPGIRTVVFFKGCPLRCRWCSNPESQRFEPEISYVRDRCIGREACGLCAKLTPDRVAFSDDGKAVPDLIALRDMPECARVCPSGALKMQGRSCTIEEVIGTVEKDQVFYARGKGGMTVSGGEPLAQPGALIALLWEAKRRHLHTALETCGMGSYEVLKEAASCLDVIHYDIKSMDSEKHRQWTGSGNGQILENISRLCAENTKAAKVIRTPVIPGFNDTEEEIEAIGRFVCTLPGARHELLPYHAFGKGKYAALGRRYGMGDVSLCERQQKRIAEYNKRHRVPIPPADF